MKQWEDIIKEKLDGYESTLPEGSLAEFRARRNATFGSRSKKLFPLFLLAGATAAGLAAFLFLQRPEEPGDDIRIIQHQTAPVVMVTDSSDVIKAAQAKPLLAQAFKPGATRAEGNIPQEPDITQVLNQKEPDTEDIINEEVVINTNPSAPDITVSSPFIPEDSVNKPVSTKPVFVNAGIITGAGVIGGLVDPVYELLKARDYSFDWIIDKDVLCESPSHSMPFKIGISTRIPLSDKLNLTTGVEYSKYSSIFTYTISGAQKQLARYLSVPVRLDWTIASSKWLDVYAGGGIEGAWCLGATLDGIPIQKDGIGFSLIGAGGIQLNLTKNIGLYVEPELSWAIPSENRVLSTYRTKLPVMFTTTGGVRITIVNNR